MNDLGDLFNEADANAAREAGDSRLESGEFGAVRKKVRNAHTRSAVLRTFLVAGAAFALGAAAVSGMKFLGGTEVADSPAPSPTTSSSDTAQAWPGFGGKVTVDPHLPDALAITPEVWASVEPGWALISYREDWPGAGDTALYGPAGDLPGFSCRRPVRTHRRPRRRGGGAGLGRGVRFRGGFVHFRGRAELAASSISSPAKSRRFLVTGRTCSSPGFSTRTASRSIRAMASHLIC